MDGRVGLFIREQRKRSRLTLRGLSGLTGVSMPYLSQVERGLRKPSAEILQGIAKGLRVSAETLYVQAGILEDRPVPDVTAAIMADPGITERQKQALVQIYEAFREEAARPVTPAPDGPASPKPTNTKKTKPSSPRARNTARGATGTKKAAATPRTTTRAGARTKEA